MTMFELLNDQLLVRTSLSKETTAVVLGLSLYKLLFKEKRDLGECSVHILRGPWISRRKKEWSNQNNNAVQWVFYLTSAQETTYVSIYKCYVCSRYLWTMVQVCQGQPRVYVVYALCMVKRAIGYNRISVSPSCSLLCNDCRMTTSSQITH